MTFLKIILAIVVIYYLFYLIIKYLFPYLLRRHIRKTHEKYYGNKENKKKKGEINIDYVPDKDKQKKDNDLGDYVDYEEIED